MFKKVSFSCQFLFILFGICKKTKVTYQTQKAEVIKITSAFGGINDKRVYDSTHQRAMLKV